MQVFMFSNMDKLIMFFVYYPCNSIKALNSGCIDAPICISYADTPWKHADVQGNMGYTDVCGGV